MAKSNNFHQTDVHRRGDGDGNDSKAPIAGEGDMTKAVYDSNDDGRVDSADFAESANSANEVAGAPAIEQYYGTDSSGTKGFHDLPAGGSGSSTFKALTDTPSSYLGAAGYAVVVNGTETGLEFVVASGTGDMTKAVYDTDNNGVVDNAEAVGGVAESELAHRSEKTTAGTGTLPNWAAWIADTSGGALSRAMPTAPEDGEEVTVFDVNGNASTNNITLTVTPPTTISDAVINVDGGAKRWRYDASGDVWDVVFSQAPSTGGGGVIPTDGLQLRYTMSNITGSTLFDETGNYDGTITGATQVASPTGFALDFSGSDYVDTGERFNFIHQTCNFSVHMLVDQDTYNDGTLRILIGSTETSGAAGFFIGFEDRAAGSFDRALRVYISTGSGITIDLIPQNVEPATGYNLVSVEGDGAFIYCYINGEVVGGGKIGSTTASPAANTVLLGSSTTASSFKYDGTIDEVYIYNRPLTSDERAALVAAYI